MSVDVALHAARVCEYCGAGTTLVEDLDGDLMCAEGTGCAAPPATTRIAGCVVAVEALESPEPSLALPADGAAALVAGMCIGRVEIPPRTQTLPLFAIGGAS